MLVLAGAVWWFTQNPSHPLPLVEGDAVSSWDFQGIHKDEGALEKKANDEITRLTNLLGGDQSGKDDDPTDYILYVSIANQYELLGDGKNAYEYLGRAVNIDSTKTGLAWHNLGSLLERLGAYGTARVAYAKAVEAQPHIEQYHVARLRFLMGHLKDDTSAIEAAFGEAEAQFGKEAPFLLQIRAQWEEITGRLDEAASTLEDMQRFVGSRNTEVDHEIARLRSL
ncbi:MAG TPA: tetratricopeptide repeat protein [Rhodothermia bacterium]|nr:tetratricopeptide repeat protein [Rhodothermia bacterium]